MVGNVKYCMIRTLLLLNKINGCFSGGKIYKFIIYKTKKSRTSRVYVAGLEYKLESIEKFSRSL